MKHPVITTFFLMTLSAFFMLKGINEGTEAMIYEHVDNTIKEQAYRDDVDKKTITSLKVVYDEDLDVKNINLDSESGNFYMPLEEVTSFIEIDNILKKSYLVYPLELPDNIILDGRRDTYAALCIDIDKEKKCFRVLKK